MASLKVLIFFCLAVAMVFAAEERVKKDVLVGAVGAYPYAYNSWVGSGYVPTAYSAGAYPTAYSGYHGINAYSAYPAYRSIYY